MTDNIGEKIKTTAIVLGIINAVGSLVAGIAVAASLEMFWLFLVIFFGGLIYTFISYILLYGYGIIVATNERIRSVRISQSISSSSVNFPNPSANLNTWECPQCHHRNDLKSTYCGYCGKPKQ